MVRSTAIVGALLALAGCAQSDPITGQPPVEPTTTPTGAAGTGGSGEGGDLGDLGDDRDDGGSSDHGGSGSDDASSSASGGDGSGGGGAGGGPSSGGAPICGDGALDAGEECEDGNAIDGDGCSACVIDCLAPGVKSPVTGNCYQVFPDATTWPFAEANCAAWGGSPGLGHLASIADDVEQDLVFSMITAQAWIGVQDPITEGVYQWSDGSFWDYEHWAPGEPDNTYEEDCAFMRLTDDGGWNDHACGDVRPSYVCERRGAGTF